MTTQQPEALRLADELDAVPETGADPQTIQDAAAELRRQHARIAELEAQLEAIGAGGVSGPLMGQPQAPLGGRWYMVTHDGAATLCADREDAEKEAKNANMAWPHTAPHRAVQLVDVASVAASAGSEPVAHLWQHCETGRTRIVMPDMIVDADASWQVVGPLYLGATPPTAQAEGWTRLPGALPKPGTPVLLDIGKKYPIRAMWAAKHTLEVGMDDDSGFGEYDETTDTYYCPEGWYEWNEHEETHWAVDETPTAWCELPPNGGASHGQAPAQAAPAAVAGQSAPGMQDAIRQYTEAQDALDNREYAGINAEPYDKLLRARNAARRDLEAALAAAPATQPAPQQEARPVTPYTCPKCSALWLHWPAEQSGFGVDTLNCRSATHCDYCEKGGVEQLERLERVPAALKAPQQEAQEPVGYTHASWIAEAKRGGGGSFVGRKNAAFDVPIYTAPQPSPTPQADSQPAPANTRQIAECYGDCPTDPKTCANPCKFEGRAARAQADSVLEDAALLEFEMQHGSAIAAARKQGANHD